MKIKILIESKILLEYIKARKNGFKDSYSDFVTNYIILWAITLKTSFWFIPLGLSR